MARCGFSLALGALPHFLLRGRLQQVTCPHPGEAACRVWASHVSRWGRPREGSDHESTPVWACGREEGNGVLLRAPGGQEGLGGAACWCDRGKVSLHLWKHTPTFTQPCCVPFLLPGPFWGQRRWTRGLELSSAACPFGTWERL